MNPDVRRTTKRTALAATALLALASCATPGQSTRLRASDFEQSTKLMVASLGKSAFLADRTPASEPVYIVINKVQNLTTDLIPDAEQWMLVARVQGSLPMQELRKQKNIHFLIPPERQPMLRDAGYKEELPTGPEATHTMAAVFRAAPRTVTNDEHYVGRRQDYYLLQYSVTSIRSREVVWTDQFEFKREAKGLTID
ncbi:MAG: hypothetical protein NTW19_01845 [Planctomycetota bacterium]|nr:hypothetical protein [Planctomycetota bacterium]